MIFFKAEEQNDDLSEAQKIVAITLVAMKEVIKTNSENFEVSY